MLGRLGSLRGRLLGAAGLAVCCFLGALAFDALQLSRIGAALQVVDAVYVPLTRLTVTMAASATPEERAAAVDEARRVVDRAATLHPDEEERVAIEAARSQIGLVASAPREQVRSQVQQLAQLVDGRIAAVSRKTAAAHARAERVSRVVGLLAVGLGVALLWITGSALRPVTELTAQVRRVGAGERAAPLPVSGSDEIAELARAFDQMASAVEERDRSLQALTLYLRRVLDSIGAAVVVVEEGTVRMANPAAHALWGLSEGDALPEALASLERGRHERREGERVEDVAVEPFGESGRILVGEDVTERVRDRERLVRSERLALVGQMLAQVTHEVRNPLNAMSLHAELLADELGDNALLKTITAEIRRLEGVTERYLDLARRRPPELAAEDPVALARGVVALEEEKLRRQGVAVRLDAGDVGVADIDGNALRRALLNLVRNAAEAGAHEVVVRVGRDDGQLVFEVRDDGPGMEPDVAARVFDPFFSTRAKGTGLGLAITRQTVEDLGGSVTVATAPGEGTRFVLRVPG